VRRTILAAYLVRGVYSLLDYGFCMHELFVYALCFDARSGLWEAASEEEWDERRLRASPTRSDRTWGSDPLMSLREFTATFVRDSSGINAGPFETMILVSHHGKSAMGKHLQLVE
jgi:hypothetical protein